MLKLKTQVDDVVTGDELEWVKYMRQDLEEQRAEADALAKRLHEREQALIARIEAGAHVEGGNATVVERRRQNISWLTIVKRKLGVDAIIEAKNEWPVAFYKELQIG
jgi:hypothetical protein